MERGLYVPCPTCGTLTALQVDLDEGSDTYESDCQTCCRPLHVRLVARPGQGPEVVEVEAGW